ncbi:MAG: hypothetical protein KA383_12000 [Phycisphaerae bacterium]|jgi:hypothetical protein|nr:hypothetical protein [Phycisphaerae bacterium]
MGRATYYSPLWLGALLVLALNEPLRVGLTLPDATEWLIVAALAIAAGLQSQVLLVGAQGAFAQVLPVPWGRSVRGRSAALAGWLLIAWVWLSVVTVMLGFETVTQAALVVGVLSLAALAGALIVYIWNIPAAVRDFATDERR